jgi:hypothetical protein
MSIVRDTAENLSSEKVRLGAGRRVNHPPPVVGENFLLTSPFIESPDFLISVISENQWWVIQTAS